MHMSQYVVPSRTQIGRQLELEAEHLGLEPGTHIWDAGIPVSNLVAVPKPTPLFTIFKQDAFYLKGRVTGRGYHLLVPPQMAPNTRDGSCACHKPLGLPRAFRDQAL